MSIYDFNAITIDGEEVSLKQYKGKVLIIVNTASKCGFTPQYKGLEKLYEQYKDKGFEILGFPSNQFAAQEPGESSEIKNFCEINYGVSFPLFEKTDVRGKNAHPIFEYLTEKAKFKGFDLNQPNEKKFNDMLEKKFPELLVGNSVKWNFTKFLIGRDGNVEYRFEPTTTPEDISTDIEKLLGTATGSDVTNKEIYTGEDDEEVLNCEGGPCNFVYDDKNEN
ncbi:glutathione peroxidase [Clostridium estertheticum]|nr:glutathione peroxidase [Clostridium estertheticum]MBX4270865.1 glutathione peroxidase [Clostridium estertheticum]WLC78646.1 glutathione peroxidase [Clostridium estertheticum]WLC89667.1 glutathione peroxidase [Clostridium estertheticum]